MDNMSFSVQLDKKTMERLIKESMEKELNKKVDSIEFLYDEVSHFNGRIFHELSGVKLVMNITPAITSSFLTR